MGTAEVYEAIEAHGGRATGAQIRTWLWEKYPNLTYWQYYGTSLSRLIKQGKVSRSGKSFSIAEKFGERNIVTIGKNGRVYKVKQ